MMIPMVIRKEKDQTAEAVAVTVAHHHLLLILQLKSMKLSES